MQFYIWDGLQSSARKMESRFNVASIWSQEPGSCCMHRCPQTGLQGSLFEVCSEGRAGVRSRSTTRAGLRVVVNHSLALLCRGKSATTEMRGVERAKRRAADTTKWMPVSAAPVGWLVWGCWQPQFQAPYPSNLYINCSCSHGHRTSTVLLRFLVWYQKGIL